MAVVLVVLILVGVILGASGYIQRKVTISRTKAVMVAIESALDAYKANFGYYPRTAEARISSCGLTEATNNWYLYRALIEQNRYLTLPAAFVRPNSMTHTNATDRLTNIFDPYDNPYNYYNSPETPYNCFGCTGGTAIPPTNTGYTVGGQINSSSYDLFSYGPDGKTFVANAIHGTTSPWKIGWGVAASTNNARDDITNWSP